MQPEVFNNKDMELKYSFGSFILLFAWLLTTGYDINAQSIDDLEKKHGFQDIILDTDITENPKLVYKK